MATPAPFAGQRADIPMPRERTPSPIRQAAEQSNQPAPARDFEIVLGNVDVIYAEDEEVFRETAIRELMKAGFSRSNIYESENGHGALEHLARLQNEGNAALPLLVVLDVRMPGMDGRECAFQIQELVKKKVLRREPFVMCISSIHRQVTYDEGKGNFQCVLPKPFNTKMVNEALELLRKWWTLGHGRQLPAWKNFDLSMVDILAADDEPVCRLSSYTAFCTAGINIEAVVEVDSEQELLERCAALQDTTFDRPLVVLLGRPNWAPVLKQAVEASKGATKREPFVVCTSIDSDVIGGTSAVQCYHAFLPRSFTQGDVKWCLELCRLWWLTRGDGPAQNDDESGSESGESHLSEGSD